MSCERDAALYRIWNVEPSHWIPERWATVNPHGIVKCFDLPQGIVALPLSSHLLRRIQDLAQPKDERGSTGFEQDERLFELAP